MIGSCLQWMWGALVFCATAIVALLAVFGMIGIANSVHAKLKERIVFSGLSCLFMFFFAWLRIGAAKQFVVKMRRARKQTSLWEALDLLVIVGGIAIQLFYIWSNSKSKEVGGPLEEASTVFWLWLAYLLCALVVTPTGGGGDDGKSAGAENVRAPETAVQVYIVERIGDNTMQALALHKKLKKTTGANLFGKDDPVVSDGKLGLAIGNKYIETLREMRELPVGQPLLHDGVDFFFGLYTRVHAQYVNRMISEGEWSEFKKKLGGATPARLIQHQLSRWCMKNFARMHISVVIDDLLLTDLNYEGDGVFHAIQLMGLRSILQGGRASLRSISIRVLQSDRVSDINKRALIGTHEHAHLLASTLRERDAELELELANPETKKRFEEACEFYGFPGGICESVGDAYTELAKTYNSDYLERE